MARNTSATSNVEPLPMGSRQATRLMLVLVGAAVLSASLVTPWWTRGVTEDFNDDNPRPEGAAVEGFYVQYRPYMTPASPAGFSTDAGRETATAVLGIALTVCSLFVAAIGVLRLGMHFGWIETNHDVPVRLAIVAFIVGIFAVIWGAFFLPLLGPNPGMLYGNEGTDSGNDFFTGSEQDFTESTRYANVGFFLGIVGAVGFPAYLWADAARTRALSGTTNPKRSTSSEPTF